MAWYRQGTVSINNGSTKVTGFLTSWLNQAKAEDRITFNNGAKWYEIAAVGDNDDIDIATPLAEATIVGGAYAIDRSGRRWGQASDVSAMIAELLALFPALGGAGDALKVLRANAGGTAFDLASAPGDVTAASNFSADNRLVRSDGTGKGVQASPVVVDDTTGALSRAGGGGIPIQGTNTSGNAAAGMVGQVIDSIFSGLSLTSGTYTNGTSIELTAGDWDVYFYGDFNPSAATMTSITASLSDTSETIGLTSRSTIIVLPGMNGRMLLPRVHCRLNLSNTQTWYLVVRALFSGGTATAGGLITARRAR